MENTTPIAYFHKFLVSNYNQAADSIIPLLLNKEVEISNESYSGTDVMPGEDESGTYNFSQEQQE
jgi:hypothetical protein